MYCRYILIIILKQILYYFINNYNCNNIIQHFSIYQTTVSIRNLNPYQIPQISSFSTVYFKIAQIIQFFIKNTSNMMFYILVPFLLVFVYGLFEIVIKPLVQIIILKIQYGSQILIYFFPLKGIMYTEQQSYKKYKDSLYIIRNMVVANPDIKFIATNILNRVMIVSVDPKLSQFIYQNPKLYIKIDKLGNGQLSKKGLIFAEGHRWSYQREMLNDSFRYDKLKEKFPMMNRVVREKLQNTHIKNVPDYITQITGEVVLQSFFGQDGIGIKIEGQDAAYYLGKLFQDIAHLQKTNAYVLLKQLMFGDKASNVFPLKLEKDIQKRTKFIKQFLSNIIDARIESKRQSDDFLDVMLKEFFKQDSKLTKDEISHQFFTLFVAGSETSQITITASLYYLAKYPDVFKELKEEVMSIVGNREVTPDDLTQLIKLNAFFSEVLRMNSPAPTLIPRKVVEQHYNNGILIKKGWYMQQFTSFLRYSEKYADNPMQFNYKRTLEEQEKDYKQVFYPFSSGKRNCIGQHIAQFEIKITLVHILRDYNVILKRDPGWIFKLLYQVDDEQCIEVHKNE
ncbi:hypothetical protein pb186bvf_019014 [Paramecium bursaria]